jgi:hypothetical protein
LSKAETFGEHCFVFEVTYVFKSYSLGLVKKKQENTENKEKLKETKHKPKKKKDNDLDL